MEPAVAVPVQKLAYHKYVSFSTDATLVNKVTTTIMKPIDFSSKEIFLKISPKLDVKVFGALSTITTNTIKHAASVLFLANCETHNARNVLEFF